MPQTFTKDGTLVPMENRRAALGAVARDPNMQRRGLNQVKLGALCGRD